MLSNQNSLEDIAEIDRVLANIDAEVATYLDENNQLKIDFILEHLQQVEIYPDRVVVMIPLFSEGMVVYKTQYVSGEKWSKIHTESNIHYLSSYKYWNKSIDLYVRLVA